MRPERSVEDGRCLTMRRLALRGVLRNALGRSISLGLFDHRLADCRRLRVRLVFGRRRGLALFMGLVDTACRTDETGQRRQEENALRDPHARGLR